MEPIRKRCRRYNEPGHAHALTFSCFRRQPFLARDRSRQWLVDALARGCRQHAMHLWAWVIMPEHAHVLVWPTRREYDISRFLQSMKTSVTRTALAFVRRHAPDFLARMRDAQPNGEVHFRFWQRGGGHDRNVFESVTIFIIFLRTRFGSSNRPM